MSVFISYRHTDRLKANEINNKLRNAGIETYLDVLDGESQTTNDITNVITENIKRSSHLLAIVSQSTVLSWWVPFEIGEATITNRRICTYHHGVDRLPEYLDKWPKLSQMDDLTLFISEYKKDTTRSRAGLESFDINKSQFTQDKIGADSFHKALKGRIVLGY
ncbi:toll/interleukin-1 receptor domain-containing protein [Serratia sp. IR-2025]